MILKSLKNSHSYLIILFLLFSILFFIPSFFTLQFQSIENQFPFYSILLLLISATLTFFHSIGLNNLIYDKDNLIGYICEEGSHPQEIPQDFLILRLSFES